VNLHPAAGPPNEGDACDMMHPRVHSTHVVSVAVSWHAAVNKMAVGCTSCFHLGFMRKSKDILTAVAVLPPASCWVLRCCLLPTAQGARAAGEGALWMVNAAQE
jgi:hypothetical protein